MIKNMKLLKMDKNKKLLLLNEFVLNNKSEILKYEMSLDGIKNFTVDFLKFDIDLDIK